MEGKRTANLREVKLPQMPEFLESVECQSDDSDPARFTATLVFKLGHRIKNDELVSVLNDYILHLYGLHGFDWTLVKEERGARTIDEQGRQKIKFLLTSREPNVRFKAKNERKTKLIEENRQAVIARIQEISGISDRQRLAESMKKALETVYGQKWQQINPIIREAFLVDLTINYLPMLDGTYKIKEDRVKDVTNYFKSLLEGNFPVQEIGKRNILVELSMELSRFRNTYERITSQETDLEQYSIDKKMLADLESVSSIRDSLEINPGLVNDVGWLSEKVLEMSALERQLDDLLNKLWDRFEKNTVLTSLEDILSLLYIMASILSVKVVVAELSK